MRSQIAAISRVFMQACWNSALAWALALSVIVIGGAHGHSQWRAQEPALVKKAEARLTLDEVRELVSIPVLYTRDDPWIVHVVPTISFRGDHYAKKPTAEADKSELKRLDELKKKQKRSSIEPSALLAYAKADVGKRGPQLGLPSSLWCADAINAWLRKVGLPGSRSRMARSFAAHPNFVKVKKPVPGDIVVIARGRSKTYGHVALYNGKCGKGGIRMLGGNQGGGRVTDQCVYGRTVIAFVRPKALATQIASS